jgi:hypothetical protein
VPGAGCRGAGFGYGSEFGSGFEVPGSRPRPAGARGRRTPHPEPRVEPEPEPNPEPDSRETGSAPPRPRSGQRRLRPVRAPAPVARSRESRPSRADAGSLTAFLVCFAAPSASARLRRATARPRRSWPENRTASVGGHPRETLWGPTPQLPAPRCARRRCSATLSRLDRHSVLRVRTDC